MLTPDDDVTDDGDAQGSVDLLAYDIDAVAGGLNEQVYYRLRQAILSGAYRPGTGLNIKPIALQLGVSPMPVREALGRLSSEGALDVLPRSGFKIPTLTSEAFRELLVMRIRLEGLAGEYAAARVTVSDLSNISAAYDEMVEASRRGYRDMLNAHRKFHFSIYSVGGGRHLLQAIEGLWLKIGPQVYKSVHYEQEPFNEAHHRILSALKAGDPAAVAHALRNDIVGTLGPEETR